MSGHRLDAGDGERSGAYLDGDWELGKTSNTHTKRCLGQRKTDDQDTDRACARHHLRWVRRRADPAGSAAARGPRPTPTTPTPSTAKPCDVEHLRTHSDTTPSTRSGWYSPSWDIEFRCRNEVDETTFILVSARVKSGGRVVGHERLSRPFVSTTPDWYCGSGWETPRPPHMCSFADANQKLLSLPNGTRFEWRVNYRPCLGGTSAHRPNECVDAAGNMRWPDYPDF